MLKIRRPELPVALYPEIRDQLDTGDVVLFSGSGQISTGIKWLTRSYWSHVGMVVKVAQWDVVLLWESTPLSQLENIENGRETRSVQLAPLSRRLQLYDGDVAVRRLVDLRRTRRLLKPLQELRDELRRRPYEEDKIELLKSAWSGPLDENADDLASLFSGEVVAEAYQRMGLLSHEVPLAAMRPVDFSSQRELTLTHGRLEKEVYVKPPELADVLVRARRVA